MLKILSEIKKINIHIFKTLLNVLSFSPFSKVFTKDFYHFCKWRYYYETRNIVEHVKSNIPINIRFQFRICDTCYKKEKRINTFSDEFWVPDTKYTIDEKREIAFRKLNI